ncbi:MAG TPA: succinylglutamate desuccinylase/aspartoacylase family protein, partial [Paracoccus sp. (in: a-proteobacteria)]|nr:succinylglutamate desuccinylase/aspartoacylase family protein [Paracoccus sp. (in: a-proteobacteria)]
MIRYDTVACALDIDAPGKSWGWVELDHSDNDWDYTAIRSPLGVIRGGGGPVALVTGGNHGDEYEGQIIARRLFERLAPEDVPGGLILMPALNMPAVLDARRVSPLDRGNMNRSFPGAMAAGPTRALAGLVTTHLMPRAGLVIDLHSGGTNADYIDCAYLTLTGDAQADRRNRALAETFGLPWTVVVP